MRAGWMLAATALAGCGTTQAPVELTVSGPPIDAQDLAVPMEYKVPVLAEGEQSGGRIEQGWAFLGREDRAAEVPGSDEYLAAPCPLSENAQVGMEAALDAIALSAKDTRIVIVNESHHVTRHRDFSRRLLERLRPLGYTVFAAETFRNTDDGPDPVDNHAGLAYPHVSDGWYSAEPVFGRLVRSAREAGFRLAAYEHVGSHDGVHKEDWKARIAAREQAQADNLGAVFASMTPDEKLLVHVGYSHADERELEDEYSSIWMAARLRRLTGIDPLTIGQTICRGGGGETRLLPMPADGSAPFDYAVDHPVESFRYGRASWRFEGAYAVPVPLALRPDEEPLVIEAFRAGEPFDAVPEDRVYVEPGEDVRLALPAGRYTVRAVRLTEN